MLPPILPSPTSPSCTSAPSALDLARVPRSPRGRCGRAQHCGAPVTSVARVTRGTIVLARPGARALGPPSARQPHRHDQVAVAPGALGGLAVVAVVVGGLVDAGEHCRLERGGEGPSGPG